MPPGMLKSDCGSLLTEINYFRTRVRTTGVKRRSGTDACPHNGDKAHSKTNSTDTVVDITVRRTPVQGSDSSHILDDLLCPAELGNELLSRLGSSIAVTPGVHAELMLTEILLLQQGGVRDSTRTDHEERRLQVLLIEIVEQVGRVWRWAVVVRKTPRELVGTGGHVGLTSASTASPPATALISCCLGVGSTTT